MNQKVDTGSRSFEAGAAIGKHILVKLSSGKLDVAGLGDEWIGTINAKAFASGDRRSVDLRSKQGTIVCIASGAFSEGDVVFGRAAGKIDDISATSAVRVGIALEAAAAAEEEIEVLIA